MSETNQNRRHYLSSELHRVDDNHCKESSSSLCQRTITQQHDKRLQIETNHKAKCCYFLFDSDQVTYEIIDSDYKSEATAASTTAMTIYSEILTPFLKSRVQQLRSYTFKLFSTASRNTISPPLLHTPLEVLRMGSYGLHSSPPGMHSGEDKHPS